MVRVKSSQRLFTAEEVTSLTGICEQHLRDVAMAKHIGWQSASPAGADEWRFTNSDLMILTVLQPRCQH